MNILETRFPRSRVIKGSRPGGSLFRRAERRPRTPRAILVDSPDPKLSISFLAFLPRFVASDDPHALARMPTLGGASMATTFVMFVG